MRLDTPAVRDRIAAVLRDAGQPLTTAEVCERAGPYNETRPHIDWRHEYPEGQINRYVRLISCDGRYDTLSMSLACENRGYSLLTWMERNHKARRIKTPGQNSVSWVLLGGEVDHEIVDLERAWDAS